VGRVVRTRPHPVRNVSAGHGDRDPSRGRDGSRKAGTGRRQLIRDATRDTVYRQATQ
jgi:hypothetical protein